MGWVMRECSEEVRLGITRDWSVWSRVPGRPSRSPVRGRTKEVCVLREGAIVVVGVVVRVRRDAVVVVVRELGRNGVDGRRELRRWN